MRLRWTVRCRWVGRVTDRCGGSLAECRREGPVGVEGLSIFANEVFGIEVPLLLIYLPNHNARTIHGTILGAQTRDLRSVKFQDEDCGLMSTSMSTNRGKRLYLFVDVLLARLFSPSWSPGEYFAAIC